ncbi:hypothetical protein PMI35_00700 [Pseudomonas sp. GM78]|uniref:hypothetical protein n=1 Tax=Pseudomonas sp. GM78 TaxID=1144337 RepID=UPI00026F9775|nr:hypothetical protein [Pseudomonas sp. GM78]EJN33825.1 hypothetical protein PMI35_00700 [Pseudomonas sp. GM78]
MPITGTGWEMHIIRTKEQRRSSDGKRRTVGTYQVFHDGQKQTGPGLSGMVAETRGPGDNSEPGNNRRVEAGRYPLATQDGVKYVTFGYKDSDSVSAKPRPGLELLKTGNRSEILVHPGIGFLSSIGCINPCTSLPNAEEMIDFAPSRRRVIALIEDLKSFVGTDFPSKNGRKIPNAFVVIEGEPTFP